MKLRNGSSDWGILLALTVLWGSAFLFTKLAVDSIPPQLVVVGRLVVAALLLVPLAVFGGALCYAVAAVLARLRPPGDALSSAAATTLIATLMIAPFALGVGQAQYQAASVSSTVSVAVLGVFSTALASVLYFRLIKTAGPAFVSQLNYFIPLWAVLVGVVFLGEHPESRHLIALCLILGGVLVSQFEYRRPRAERKTREEARSTA